MSDHASASAKASASVPVLGLLGVLFVALKLTGHIAWDWKWVLAPFWAPLGICVAVALVALLGMLLVAAFTTSKQSRR